MNSQWKMTSRTRFSNQIFSFVAVVLASVLLAGCSQSPYEIAEARGVVTIDGVPFTEGKVMFSPVAKAGETKAGRTAFGLLDSQGRFTLSTDADGDGAVVGEHRVTLFHTGKGPRQFNRVTLPQGLVTIASGEVNEVEVSFTADEIKKYGNRL